MEEIIGRKAREGEDGGEIEGGRGQMTEDSGGEREGR